jgi:hypothetical protein
LRAGSASESDTCTTGSLSSALSRFSVHTDDDANSCSQALGQSRHLALPKKRASARSVFTAACASDGLGFLAKVSYFIQLRRLELCPNPRLARNRDGRADHKAPKEEARGRFDPALFFETAAKGRTISKHRKSEIIFSQGDDANAVFYIKKGKVKVTVVSKQGKEAVVAIQGIDEFVGEGCLIGQPKRLAKCHVRMRSFGLHPVPKTPS